MLKLIRWHSRRLLNEQQRIVLLLADPESLVHGLIEEMMIAVDRVQTTMLVGLCFRPSVKWQFEEKNGTVHLWPLNASSPSL